MDASVYIIILNWNQYLLTAECIRSLLTLDYSNYRIVVVDNGSADGTVEKLLIEFGVQIELIANATNLGFTGGNNVGIRFALTQDADYVMLLNNDTIVEDRYLLCKLVEVAESETSIGMACPSIFYHEMPTKVWYAGSELSLWNGWKHYYQVPSNKTPVDTGYASGCCVLVSAPLLEQIGLLNEAYFFSVEDLEWSLRAKRAGWRIVYVPDASVLHKDSVSSKDQAGKGVYSPTRVYYEHRNAIWMIREYANPVQKCFIWPVRFAREWIYKLLGYLFLRRWAKLIALLRALRDGLFVSSLRFRFPK